MSIHSSESATNFPQSLSLQSYILCHDKKMRSPNLLLSLKKLRIPLEIIDGSTIEETIKYLQCNSNIHKKSRAFQLSHKVIEAQLACTFGHLIMHNAFKKSEREWGLFLENDATIDTDLLSKILESIENLPRGIILLGACGGWARKTPELIVQNVELHRVFNSAITGSHAYLVHISQIEKMIRLEKNLVSLADEFIREKMKMYITVPYISLQSGSSASSIQLTSRYKSMSIWRKVFSSLFWDIRDIRRLGRCGNRALRLEIFESALDSFLLKLPGCNEFHLSQMGSTKDQP